MVKNIWACIDDEFVNHAIRSAKKQAKPVSIAIEKMKLFIKAVEKRPREALSLWKEFVKNINAGKLLDGVRAHKLNNLLKYIPNRVVKDAHQRVIGQGNKVVGALRSLENQLRKIPKNSAATSRMGSQVNSFAFR